MAIAGKFIGHRETWVAEELISAQAAQRLPHLELRLAVAQTTALDQGLDLDAFVSAAEDRLPDGLAITLGPLAVIRASEPAS